MVGEVLEAQTESVASSTPIETHDVAEGFQVFRLAVGGKSHHFVLVAEFREAEILRYRGVVEAERVREGDSIRDTHAVAFPAPHMVLAKSPRPSAESNAARSNGETKNALAR